MNRAARRIPAMAVALLVVGAPLRAQSIEIGERLSISSSILGEQRDLLVHLPESYATSSFRYPVLYVLDGDSDFEHTVAIVDFLAGTDQMPELIVVGVPNTHRSRDLTPPSADTTETAFWPAVGGADRFRRFFAEELIPFVDERYRTEPYRILRGQSFGGLFAIHDYMSGSPTFDAYLTSSPAVSWNFGELIDAAPGLFARSAKADGPGRPLYVASAGRDFPGNLAGIRRFASAVERAIGPTGPRWLHEHFPAERHYTVVLPATLGGLRFLYAHWQPTDDVERTADVEAYEAHYRALSEEFGYEIRIPLQTVVRLGNQLLREQRFDEGISVLRRNLDLYPERPEGYWHVGDGLVLAGRPEEARPYLRRAYELAVELGLPDVEDYRESLERAEE
ncbi:MAG: alpha/beta hydrolase-fold protein [Gemmatimonadales bacterium]